MVERVLTQKPDNNRVLPAVVTFAALAVMIVFTVACVETQPLHPVNPATVWHDYTFSYDPPSTAPPTSVKITLAVVAPNYPDGDQYLSRNYKKVSQGWAKSFATDLDKIIVAKGMTVTGNFDSLDLMTYPDKKNANLSLTPEFVVTQETHKGHPSLKGGKVVTPVEVHLNGTVRLIMREPLSSEKIWIKTIPVDNLTESSEIVQEAEYTGNGIIPGNIIYNGAEDSVANMIKKLYPSMMDTVWRYLDVQEIAVLKDKANEVRKLKRF